MSKVRRFAALLLAVLAVLGTAVLSPGALLTSAAARTRPAQVSVTVLSVSPTTPAITSSAVPLIITVALENTTGKTLSGVTLAAARANPLLTQAELDQSLVSRSARTGGNPVTAVRPSTMTLSPGVPVNATFVTTTSTENSDRICLCVAAGVYPLDVTAQNVVDGVPEVLGGTRTYLPAFDVPPAHKLGVTWIWPLVDRPHRLADGNVFTDDDLATSVASGGRLDRALQVVELAERTVPMTLVVDPDLIDELQVMSLGRYTIRATDGTLTPGTGQQVATAWLVRLRALLDAHPDTDLQFTPLADPDVTGLTQHDQSWSTMLDSTVQARIVTALGGRVPSHTLAWPPSNSATVETLDRLVTGGATTVLLDGSRVRPSTSGGIPVTATRLRTTDSSIAALLTSPALQRYAQSAIAGGAGALPVLMSELAIRVAQRPSAVQGAVLTPPRYVDVASPAVAANVITTTSVSVFSQPAGVAVARQQVRTGARSSVRAPVSTSTALTDGQLELIRSATGYLRPVASLIDRSRAGRSITTALPDTVQRSESAAWSSAGSAVAVGGGPVPGNERVTALIAQLSGYLKQVHILNPPSSSYTLASTNSPLLISVVNTSTLTVWVVVSVSTVGGLPGFATREEGPIAVGPNSKTTVKIRTHIQRSGRIPVQAQLRTPDNYALDNVKLFVHSTVLGTIGVVITIVAGAVLALALLVRFGRRVVRIRTKRARAAAATAAPPSVEHEPAP